MWRLDRLGRSVRDLIELINKLKAEDVQFVSLTEQMDTSSPMGTFLFHITAAMEPETIADFGAGVCTKGMMRGRLAFPLHNVMGELVAYTGFKLDKASDGPLWLLPKDFQPELELIGAHVPVADASAMVLTFDMLEAAYAAQALRHPVLTILSAEISERQETRIKSLIEDQGFAGTFLVLAAPSEKSGSNPALIDQAVLKLARLAPTKCVLLP